ncbi:MAG: D-alanyl-D-alanine carboxypeptidase [Pseudomonadota bacterium]
MSSLIVNLVATVLAAVIWMATVPSVHAAAKFAAITIDAHNGRILYARNIDAPRYPASLTKIMTLYVLFQDLEAGRIKMDSRLRVSKFAASRQPSKLGLKPGSSIKVRDAIKALVTKSANDVATTVAEGLGGTEANFALRMTRTARHLGMTRTTFANASGLPDRRQLTTARDMATLGLRIQKDFPKYYGVFKTRRFTYKGRRYANHNRLLGRVKGVDGIKTGYTRASGFNLTSSVRRGSRHVIGVVMGAKSGKSRNRYMASILKKALKKVPNRKRRLIASTAGTPPKGRAYKPAVRVITAATLPPEPKTNLPRPTVTGMNGVVSTQARVISLKTGSASGSSTRALSKRLKTVKNPKRTPKAAAAGDLARGKTWQIQIGAFSSAEDAMSGLARARNTGLKSLKRKKALTLQVKTAGGTLYRARFAGFNRRQASRVCSALARRAIGCMAIAPRG